MDFGLVAELGYKMTLSNLYQKKLGRAKALTSPPA